MADLVQWNQAIDEFNDERFFEFHETVEELWKNEKDEQFRVLLQGLIHIAVCFYHLQNHNNVGAKNQREKAILKLGQCDLKKFNSRLNIKIDELLNDVCEWQDMATFPKIKNFIV